MHAGDPTGARIGIVLAFVSGCCQVPVSRIFFRQLLLSSSVSGDAKIFPEKPRRAARFKLLNCAWQILIFVTLHACALVPRQMFALLLLSGLAAPGGNGLWSDMFNPCE